MPLGELPLGNYTTSVDIPTLDVNTSLDMEGMEESKLAGQEESAGFNVAYEHVDANASPKQVPACGAYAFTDDPAMSAASAHWYAA